MDIEIRLEGAPVSQGIAIGTPFFLTLTDDVAIPEFSIGVGEVDREISRYRKALFSSREDLQRLQTDLRKQGSLEAVTIIDSHLQMLSDPIMTSQVEEGIRDMRRNTETVFRAVIKEVEVRFSKVKDSFFRQRIVDVKDLSKRILNHLCPPAPRFMTEIPPHSIIFTNELTPSYTAAAGASHISAFVTELGGGNSHAALIARSKGIPYIASIDIQAVQQMAPKLVIIDGTTGTLILNPSQETIDLYEKELGKLKSTYQLLEQEKHLEAETQDGHPITILANISNINEIELMHHYGALGIGLFRTEYLFLQNPFLLEDEELQFKIYSEIVERAEGLPTVIRVLDLGGDKNPLMLGEPQKEANPVLGCRGIRLLLRRKEVFKTQLRAILRASNFGQIKILLPLISDIEELRQSKALIAEVKEELSAEEIPYDSEILVGSMIEVPSAVLISDVLAKESDFLSMGTNDLVQYTLGIDRSNPLMSDFSFPAHPSVIRLIKMSVENAKRHQKPISACGEIASSPLFIPLLIGLGVQELSCPPRYIPLVKRAIRSCSYRDAVKLADEILHLQTSPEIAALLNARFPDSQS